MTVNNQVGIDWQDSFIMAVLMAPNGARSLFVAYARSKPGPKG
jgi:hypothetical protein